MGFTNKIDENETNQQDENDLLIERNDDDDNIGDDKEVASSNTGASEGQKQTVDEHSIGKCTSCSKGARKGCIENLCIKCCTNDSCEVHKELREKAIWKEQVMNGTTSIQQEAKWKRSKVIPRRRFKEPNFKYMGDTVIIFDLQQCMNDTKLRDEILRKSYKRRVRTIQHHSAIDGDNNENKRHLEILRNNRKRFHNIYEQLYQKGLNK